VFLTGYGFAQSVPGPLFSVAVYLGAATAAEGAASMVRGAICLAAIFLPGLLLAVAALGAWTRLARINAAQRALAGIGAAVVGVLAAALYDPVWTTAVRDVPDGAIAVAAVILLERFSAPPIAIVALCVMASLLRVS
jgi:chromate transporter